MVNRLVQMMKDIKILEITENLNGIKGNTAIKMDISDIINGVSKEEINPGYGHPIEYWAKYKMQAVEFFVGAISMEMNNASGAEFNRIIFPESLKIIDEMVDSLLESEWYIWNMIVKI